jgi:hypothetical protein
MATLVPMRIFNKIKNNERIEGSCSIGKKLVNNESRVKNEMKAIIKKVR